MNKTAPRFIAWWRITVTVINSLIVLLFLQAMLAAPWLPFYESVSLDTAIYEAWSNNPFGDLPDGVGLSGEDVLVVLPFGVVGIIFTIGIAVVRDLRWRMCCATLPLLLPLIIFCMFGFRHDIIQMHGELPKMAVRETLEMFQHAHDGEWWEEFPVSIAGWWYILAMLVAPVEIFLYFRQSRSKGSRGFAPIMTDSRDE